MDQPGDLAVGQAPAEFQGDDFNRTGIEDLQSLQDFLLILDSDEFLLGERVVLCCQVKIIERSDRVGLLCFPVVDGQVVGDGEQPGLDLAFARIVALQAGERLFEYGGGQIIGRVGIRAAIAEVAEDNRVIGIEDLVKRDGFGWHHEWMWNQGSLQEDGIEYDHSLDVPGLTK